MQTDYSSTAAASVVTCYTVVSLINGVFDSALKRLLHCSVVTKRVFCAEFSISGYAL